MTKATVVPPNPKNAVKVREEIVCLKNNPTLIVWKVGPGFETGYFQGVVLSSGNSTLGSHERGRVSDRWADHSFCTFEGHVILEND